ncbi:LLM class flavin-dependent oxidoreductase, partial [Amycolatopsis sp. NPDC059090]|uniref:LLM class flavin-dependent oxidoreductase n=1 Tax=Amycolatopsis sp. NPDC059090 TaxID=3346723 RepID=UPI00366F1535
MELGLQVPDFTLPGGTAALGGKLADAARAADDAGFAYLAVMDHFFQIPSVGPSDRPMLEAYTTLGYFATHTRRAELFTYVTGAIYRHPGLLAKAVTTLDVLSGGRAMLGIGAGWNKRSPRTRLSVSLQFGTTTRDRAGFWTEGFVRPPGRRQAGGRKKAPRPRG